MDEIVKAAMQKWPNVPHCYHWLALDERGRWRMRDAHMQAIGQSGDIIYHPALLDFINRNYLPDSMGAWYFQNGPQRVYVDLLACPYIVRSESQGYWRLHTGEILKDIQSISLTDTGNLIFQNGNCVAQLDDRDLSSSLFYIYEGAHQASDECLINFIESYDSEENPPLIWKGKHKTLSIEFVANENLPSRFHFVRIPSP